MAGHHCWVEQNDQLSFLCLIYDQPDPPLVVYVYMSEPNCPLQLDRSASGTKSVFQGPTLTMSIPPQHCGIKPSGTNHSLDVGPGGIRNDLVERARAETRGSKCTG